MVGNQNSFQRIAWLANISYTNYLNRVCAYHSAGDDSYFDGFSFVWVHCRGIRTVTMMGCDHGGCLSNGKRLFMYWTSIVSLCLIY